MCGNGGNAGGWLTAASGAVSDWFIQVKHTNRKTRPFKVESKLHAHRSTRTVKPPYAARRGKSIKLVQPRAQHTILYNFCIVLITHHTHMTCHFMNIYSLYVFRQWFIEKFKSAIAVPAGSRPY